MRVVFCHTAHPRLNLIAQIQLEILLKLLKEGHEVYIVKASDELIKSQTNYISPDYMVYHYHRIYDKSVKILKKEGNIVELDYIHFENELSSIKVNNVVELKQIKHKNIEIGMGVASSLISLIRDHELDTLAYKKDISIGLQNAINIIETLTEIKNQVRPKLIYVFNGRMATYAPVVDFSKKNEIDYNVFEFTSRADKYHVLNNAIPHNVSYRETEMREIWALEPNEGLKIKIASDFYERQKKGKSLMEDNFISYQKENHLPSFDRSKELISIFNSSIDEFASVPGWENYMYVFEDESSAIYKTCKHFEEDQNKQFILRIHPNLKFLNNSQVLKLQKLYTLNNLIIVEALSPVSSYSLIEASDKVITFGSTVGIEATYFNKPSILLGMSFFDNLDVAYLPKTVSEVYKLINKFDLKPKEKENTYIYGYWWMTFGEAYVYRNYTYEERFLNPSLSEIFKGGILKGFSRSLWSRAFKAFNTDLTKKLKNPAYRKAISRELVPWKKR